MEIIQELKELNLDENEIKIYTTCLKLGSAKANEIAKKSGIIRTTAYGILSSLLEKGLISSILKDNVYYFQAVNPKQLLDILDEKKRIIENIIPELEELQKRKPRKHKIEFFEGKLGIKTIINDLTRIPNSEVKIFGSYAKFVKFSEPFKEFYTRNRKKKNIKVKAIVPYSQGELIVKKMDKKELRESKFIKMEDSNAELYIYGNKIAFVSFEEDNLRGAIIEDSEVADLQHVLFDNLWKDLKK